MIEALTLQGQPLWLHVIAFCLASAAIWWAGTRLERSADVISRRTGLGEAFTGVLLLAVATSLPEVATTVTAVVVLNNPSLAVHNLLGGVALQTTILVIADRVSRRSGPLTFFTPRFTLLMQGVGLVMILQFAIAGVASKGSPTIFSVSIWAFALVLLHLAMTWFTFRHRGNPRWTATRTDDVPKSMEGLKAKEEEEAPEEAEQDRGRRSTLGLVGGFAGLSLIVLAGGWFASSAADRLAKQTGLGDAFLGATLLALATSLPEVSTTVAASKEGRYTTAISNVFGSNAFDVSLLFLADVLYREGSILKHAESTLVFVGAVGALLTCLYLVGLMEREDRTVLGVGWDSASVTIGYAVSMVVLYFMR